MTAIAVGHYEGLIDLYGEQVAIRHARKHLAAYADVAIADGFAFDVAAAEDARHHERLRKCVLDLLRSLYVERLLGGRMTIGVNDRVMNALPLPVLTIGARAPSRTPTPPPRRFST